MLSVARAAVRPCFIMFPCIFVGDVAGDKISLSCEAHLCLWV
jgi:hypothetical protein